jgi:mono/diheme cytochrome c family protein
VWNGVLDIRAQESLRWSASLSGHLTVRIGQQVVLEGTGHATNERIASAKTIELSPGYHLLEVRFRALPQIPARVHVWWQGTTFAAEPLPASRLRHLTKQEPEALAQEFLRETGLQTIQRFGCARCHRDSFPGQGFPSPGPALEPSQSRWSKEWIMHWLEDPRTARSSARMPALFAADHSGFLERWIISTYLTSAAKTPAQPSGDHRAGKQAFLGLGCIACHVNPEGKEQNQSLHPIQQLAERMTSGYLAEFLLKPHTRYPDGRMPALPLSATEARDLAAYLLQLTPGASHASVGEPSAIELTAFIKKINAADLKSAGLHLLREKGCVNCHSGLTQQHSEILGKRLIADQIQPSACGMTPKKPRFSLSADECKAITAYMPVASQETHASPFAQRQRMLHESGCFRCHQRDSDRPAPLEEIGRTLWSPHLYRLPFQRTPRLTQASSKFHPEYLLNSIREGISGVRPDWYSYRMPKYGQDAEQLRQALAEGDGELPSNPTMAPNESPDPNLISQGPLLVGFQGYGCVTCHLWNGKSLSATEPGSVGPDLTTVAQRVQYSWFTRFLDDPQRIYPGSPMPAIFKHGEPAPLKNFLGGDAAKQKEALWAYLSQGKKAASPGPKPPLALSPPKPGEAPWVLQIPVQLPDHTLLESLTLWTSNGEMAVYDLGSGQLHSLYAPARLLRQANVWRTYEITGNRLASVVPSVNLRLLRGPQEEALQSILFRGYDLSHEGMTFRQQLRFASTTLEWKEAVQFLTQGNRRRLVRSIHLECEPGTVLILQLKRPDRGGSQATDLIAKELPRVRAMEGEAHLEVTPQDAMIRLASGMGTKITATLEHPFQTVVPAVDEPPSRPELPFTHEEILGPLQQRPGYRATLYPRPKTASGEDLVMPSALTSDPKTGRLFLASMKQGDLLVLDDPTGEGRGARYLPYARGLFQDCFGLFHDGTGLYVLHRRNLTRLSESDASGLALRSKRIAFLPHAIGNAYDWAYGLVRDRNGGFFWTLAPHANPQLTGSGTLVHFSPGKASPEMQEIAYGFRNPLGWAAGPEEEIFFTDNQGDWVATNKLCHAVPGRYYGYPNHAKRGDAERPLATTAVWVPYDWAKSINGMAFDRTGGKFGPFAGQFFLAELMHGGAIIRAQVEKINGVYQGACFPFWGKGLLGPLCMAFDPQGRLWVGSITTPGWMGQPDRGALFRLDFTGHMPFEIQAIHVQPQGFRLVFTKPLAALQAARLANYRIEHYRYEYTGAYGSPELDRRRLPIVQATLLQDGRTVELITAPLSQGRVYAISAAGIQSCDAETLVHPMGVYTVNEVPMK